MHDNTPDEIYTYRLFEFAVWLILLLLIIIRAVSYKTSENSWIWVVNYIGMVIAVINIFVKKFMKLKKAKNKKCKPFIGLTVFVLVLCVAFMFPAYFSQTSDYSQVVNDVITLLALFLVYLVIFGMYYWM